MTGDDDRWRDIDLRRASAEDVRRIAGRASATGSVAIHGQFLTALELEAFVSRLGPLMFTPGETPLPETSFVFEVTNRGRTDVPRSVYHSDTSYVERPPSYTALSAARIPTASSVDDGDTVVVDQRVATSTLPASMRHHLAGVEVLHVASRVARPDDAGAGAWHPVIRHHPLLGEAVLFTSARERMVAARRRGRRLGDAEASELIDAVCAHAVTPPEHRHRWSTGDVLVLDNRVALHRADHRSVGPERTLHRVMCRGERPQPGG